MLKVKKGKEPSNISQDISVSKKNPFMSYA